MKMNYILLSMIRRENIIKNNHLPSCKNCVYFKPNMYDTDFASTLNICEKFGEKDIITDKISYDFAVCCREDENKCGIHGNYFEEEKNIKIKVLFHKIISNLPYILPITIAIVIRFFF